MSASSLLESSEGLIVVVVCEQVQSIEFSLVEKDVLFGLKQGNDVLKQLNKEMDLATVEKLMDDTREGIAYQEVRPHYLFELVCAWRALTARLTIA